MRCILAKLVLLACALVVHDITAAASDASSNIVEVALDAGGALDDSSHPSLHVLPATPSTPTHAQPALPPTAPRSIDASATYPASIKPIASSARDPPAAASESTATIALTKELEELELMIKLQEKKLALLEKIRATALGNQHAAPSDVATGERAKHTRERFEDALERKIEALTVRAANELIGPAATLARTFDERFFPRDVIQTKQRVVDIKIAALWATAHDELVVLALADGAIECYLSPALLLLRIEPTADRQTISGIDVDLLNSPASLAVIYSDAKRAVVYTLELKHHGRHVIGQQHHPQQSDGEAATFDSSSTRSEQAAYVLTATETSAIAFEATPTALAITKTARRSVLSIASNDGHLHFVALNGTLLHRMATAAQTRTIAVHRNRVAISNGSELVLLPLARGRDAAFVHCPGSTAAVTSIAFDGVHSDLIYAGTSLGEVLVYAVSDRVERVPWSSHSSSDVETAGVKGACTLAARVLANGASAAAHTSPTVVRTLKGFVIASSGAAVTVYNVSRNHDGAVSLHAVCVRTHVNSHTVKDDSKGAQHVPLLAVSDGAAITSVVIVSRFDPTARENTVHVFQSLLSIRHESPNASWLSLLYIIAVVVFVLLLQFCFRRPQPSATPPKFDPWTDTALGRRSRFRTSVGGADNEAAASSYNRSSGLGVNAREATEFDDVQRFAHEMHARKSTQSRSTKRTGGISNSSSNRGGGNAQQMSDREHFGASYDALSDELKRKIADARRETLECSFDNDDDDDDDGGCGYDSSSADF